MYIIRCQFLPDIFPSIPIERDHLFLPQPVSWCVSAKDPSGDWPLAVNKV